MYVHVDHIKTHLDLSISVLIEQIAACIDDLWSRKG